MSRIHVVGAGLAGLSAALTLTEAGHDVVLSEATARAGGRCRSYYDAQLGQTIDNGNHLVFSGNEGVNRYLKRLGATDRLVGPEHAIFAFHDLRDDARWTMAVNDGRVPWWVLNASQRAPGTRLTDYAALLRMVMAGRHTAIGALVGADSRFWERVIEPMMLAVLNCPPAQGSAWLAGRFLNASFARGGQACRTMVAMPTLGAAFVDPAMTALQARGRSVRLGRRLRNIEFDGNQVTALDFSDGAQPIGDGVVVLAVPPWTAAALVPELTVPDRFCSIVNAHFAISPPPGAQPVTALIGTTAHWVLCHGDRISVTISSADALLDRDRTELAETVWREVLATLGMTSPMPRWQIVTEKRATFAATPEQDARRPHARTRWRNLVLAGDWTQTRLPATIEGAIRSGETAARLAQRALRR